jgi:hypothetical protein
MEVDLVFSQKGVKRRDQQEEEKKKNTFLLERKKENKINNTFPCIGQHGCGI